MVCVILGCNNERYGAWEYCERCYDCKEAAHRNRLKLVRELPPNVLELSQTTIEWQIRLRREDEISVGEFWFCSCGSLVVGSQLGCCAPVTLPAAAPSAATGV